jgi:hypothetical protein
MTRLITAIILACITCANQASAQAYGPTGNGLHPPGARPMGDRGRFHGYLSKKPHSCTWSITSRCTSWKDRMGLQRHIERMEARRH